jgi:hypothetical protein
MRILITLVPFAVGTATAIALWGEEADPIFFATAAEVLAVGTLAMALEGRFFRVRGGGSGLVTAPILIAVGTGLAFAFGALARDDGGAASHVAMTGAALAMGATGVLMQALFGIADDDATPQGADGS